MLQLGGKEPHTVRVDGRYGVTNPRPAINVRAWRKPTAVALKLPPHASILFFAVPVSPKVTATTSSPPEPSDLGLLFVAEPGWSFPLALLLLGASARSHWAPAPGFAVPRRKVPIDLFCSQCVVEAIVEPTSLTTK